MIRGLTVVSLLAVVVSLACAAAAGHAATWVLVLDAFAICCAVFQIARGAA